MSVEALFQQWGKKIRTMANSSPINGMDKEDVEQELNIVLWQCSNSYDPNKGMFSTYFYNCAKNKIIKLKKHAGAKKRSAILVPLENDMGYYHSEYEDIEFISSIENNRKMTREQKNAMIYTSLYGTYINTSIGVENINEVIGI